MTTSIFHKLAALLLTFLCHTVLAAAQTTIPSKGDLTVVAWWGIPHDELTLERFQELRAAGFNATFHNMRNIDDVKRALSLGRQTGVKIIATCQGIVNARKSDIEQIKDSAALLAYSLGDEPSAKDFSRLSALAKTIRSIDSRHPVYINLLPDCGRQMLGDTYSRYLERAVDEIQLKMLSFDIYPITAKGINGGWYSSLGQAAQVARSRNLPLWAFVLSTPHTLPDNTVYPAPTLASLRLQIYSDLAYGAQAIQYFTYWLPEDPQIPYYQAPITDGKRTATYRLVRAMNKELQQLAGVFKGATVEKTYHVGQNPQGTARWDASSEVVAIDERPEQCHLLFSFLRNGNRRYVLVQNADLNAAVTVTLRLGEGMRQVSKDGRLKSVARSRRFTIKPGDILLFDSTDATAMPLTDRQLTLALQAPSNISQIGSMVSVTMLLIAMAKNLRGMAALA